MDVITYPCWDYSESMLVKGAPGVLSRGHDFFAVMIFLRGTTMDYHNDWQTWTNYKEPTTILSKCLQSVGICGSAMTVFNGMKSFIVPPQSLMLSAMSNVVFQSSQNKLQISLQFLPWISIQCQFIAVYHKSLESVTWALTHRGRVMHICIGNLTIIGSNNGLSPSRRQAITWTNAGILLIWPLGTNFTEILSKIHTFIHSRKCIWKGHLQNGDHFISASVC